IQFITASDALGRYWYLLVPWMLLYIGGLLVAIVGYYRGWGEFEVPFFGPLLLRLDTPPVLRNLALAIEAGRPVEEALEPISRSHRRRAVRAAAMRTLHAVMSGENCWESLRDAGLVRNREVVLLRAAERVGNLPWALRRLADAISQRRAFRWRAAFEIIQPAVVVAIGLTVAFLCIALFMPLIKLLNDIS
ncbi:MAG: type II secretion system F family protein, partial [Planctomycetaceae bacterium]